ncbi:MAG: circularly permuted type 2 ATP-grasp protein [Legionellaceae bacterium]|nr:circularly permuted type 2 ATP-grasp protein [Legionellaceae bacterium]
MEFHNYELDQCYDELFSISGQNNSKLQPLIALLKDTSLSVLNKKQKAAELALLNLGITFCVYGNKKSEEKIFPFDIIPRVILPEEWDFVTRGLKQRVKALNLFIGDLYGKKQILKNKVIPEDLIVSSCNYLKACEGLSPPKNIWTHISGIDLVKDSDGQFYVLEDNVRCPSGISYVLENRATLKRIYPNLFKLMGVKPVSMYADELYRLLSYISNTSHQQKTNIVVLSPGIFNSAYFEHSYLAQQMGVPLVEGRDLIVQDEKVYVRATSGFEQVHTIYRRIDDEYLDPSVFKADSLLGVKGLFNAYLKGNVALANAPGTGIADDKAVYAYTPQIIKYYLDEDPILPIIETYLCSNEKHKKHVLSNMSSVVIKQVNMSGGYGMLVGTKSTKKEQEAFKEKINANPRNYIAQPIVNLSKCPTLVKNGIEGRHVDFRPFVLYGEDTFVLPGGLTRVALNKGSLIVNSSQGGGSKDTWVLK